MGTFYFASWVIVGRHRVPVRRTPSPQVSVAELLIADGDPRQLGRTSA
jgi:hypothetical protein